MLILFMISPFYVHIRVAALSGLAPLDYLRRLLHVAPASMPGPLAGLFKPTAITQAAPFSPPFPPPPLFPLFFPVAGGRGPAAFGLSSRVMPSGGKGGDKRAFVPPVLPPARLAPGLRATGSGRGWLRWRPVPAPCAVAVLRPRFAGGRRRPCRLQCAPFGAIISMSASPTGRRAVASQGIRPLRHCPCSSYR